MPAVVHLVQVAEAQVEDLAAVLSVQVAYGFLDCLLDELRLILLVVFKHLAREQAQLRHKLPLLNGVLDIAVQRQPTDKGAVPMRIGVVGAAMRL
jgi:hypothetical protein